MSAVIGGLASLGTAVACCAVLFAVLLVALVIWYYRHQPEQVVSNVAPTPPIQATIEHPTAAVDLTAPAAPASSPDQAAPVPAVPAAAPPTEAPVAAPAPEAPTDPPQVP